jgi:hypothetical protein
MMSLSGRALYASWAKRATWAISAPASPAISYVVWSAGGSRSLLESDFGDGMQIGSVAIGQQISLWLVICPEGTRIDSSDRQDLFLSCASHVRPSRARIGWTLSVPDPVISHGLGSCKAHIPHLVSDEK